MPDSTHEGRHLDRYHTLTTSYLGRFSLKANEQVEDEDKGSQLTRESEVRGGLFFLLLLFFKVFFFNILLWALLFRPRKCSTRRAFLTSETCAFSPHKSKFPYLSSFPLRSPSTSTRAYRPTRTGLVGLRVTAIRSQDRKKAIDRANAIS